LFCAFFFYPLLPIALPFVAHAADSFHPLEELTDRFYVVLAELHAQVQRWGGHRAAGGPDDAGGDGRAVAGRARRLRRARPAVSTTRTAAGCSCRGCRPICCR